MVVIVGAGLSGLLTGYLLKKEGVPFKILEARERAGGRINTIYGPKKAPVEMGATWFTSQHKHLIALLEELEVEYFQQNMEEKVFFQATSAEPAQLVQIPNQEPSFRISGGSSSLIRYLLNQFDETEVMLNQTVTQIKFNSDYVQVNAQNAFKCDAVVMALPPKLWAKKIEFDPQLPQDLTGVAKTTQTWMEDSIKVALTYDKPFWGEEIVPGTLFSNAGPVIELYDQSNHKQTRHALCGFVDSSLNGLSPIARREKVVNQMKDVFGQKATEYLSYEECLWSKEKNTFQPSESPLVPHQNNGNPIYNQSFFDGKFLISSSEAASEFPGYMEGAVLSAKQIAEKITKENTYSAQ